MGSRMKKLQECLEIAIRKRNHLLEQNIREAIAEEEKNPRLEG